MLMDSSGKVSWFEAMDLQDHIVRSLDTVRQGDLVVLAASPGKEMTLLCFALWTRGATVLPIATDLTDYEFSRLLETCQPNLLLCNDTFLSTGLERMTLLSVLPLEGMYSSYSLIALSAEEPRQLGCALCQLTSGSTGAPKAVLLSEEAVMAGVIAQTSYWSTLADRALILPVPQHHAMGFALVLEALLHGRPVYTIDKFLPSAILDAASAHPRSVIAVTPHLVDLLKKFGVLSRLKEGVSAVVLGSAKVTPRVLHEIRSHLPDAELVVRYGLTEAFGALLQKVWSPEDTEFRDSVGLPVANCNIHPYCETASADKPVVLRVASPANASAYLDHEGKVQTILEDGYLDTGDCIYRTDAGFVIEGREQAFIKRHGYRINPFEVEEAIRQHEFVEDAVVVSNGEDDGELLALIEAINSSADVDYVAHCRSLLTAFKVPRHFLTVDAIPRTRSGKADRAQCRELAVQLLKELNR